MKQKLPKIHEADPHNEIQIMRECVTTRHLFSLHKVPNGIVGQRSTMEIYKTIHAVAKMISCSPQIDHQFLLLKTKPTQFIDHEEFELVYMEPSSVYAKVFGTGLYSTHYQEKCQHPPSHKSFDLQYCYCLQDIPGQWWNKTYGSNQSITTLT